MDLYQKISALIELALKSKDPIKWLKPWVKALTEGQYIQIIGQRPYSIRQAFIIAVQTEDTQFITEKQIEILQAIERKEIEQGTFATPEQREQAIKSGVSYLRPDAVSTIVEEWFPITKEETNEKTGKKEMKESLCRRLVEVYGLSQIHIGIELQRKLDKIKAKETPDTGTRTTEDKDEILKKICAYIGVSYETKPCNQAYYSPSEHRVEMPLPEQFKSQSEYYATAFHELGHATKGGAHPVPRDWGKPESDTSDITEATIEEQIKGKEKNREEMLAELTSLLAGEFFNTSNEHTQQNSIAYLQSWMSNITEEKREKYIFDSFQKAVKCFSVFLEATEEKPPLEEIPATEKIKYNDKHTAVYISGEWSKEHKEELKLRGFTWDFKSFAMRAALATAKRFYLFPPSA